MVINSYNKIERIESMDIGKELQYRRKSNNLTQEQLGKILNVSRQTISKWENNRSFPDIENLIWLCDIYEISLDELVGRKNISYEIKMIKKKNKRREFFYMFPKHTSKFVITGLIILMFFMGTGLHATKKEAEVLKNEGILAIYSVTSIEMDDDGYYKTFTLENGDKIKADSETIKVFGLENKVNKITPNRTDPSNHLQLIFANKLQNSK